MARKKRSDSNAEAVRYATAGEIVPPDTVPLSKECLPFFLAIIAEKPRADWSKHQIELAATLALTMRQHVKMRTELMSEDAVLVAANGGPISNPKHGICAKLETNIIAMRRSLGIHARAHGEARDLAKRTRDGLSAQGEPNDDGLLARPN